MTLVPYTRRLIVDSTLSNDRSGMAVILDAASGVAFCDPEVIALCFCLAVSNLQKPSIFRLQFLFLMHYVPVVFSFIIMSERITDGGSLNR